MTADHAVDGNAFLPSGGLDESSCYYKPVFPGDRGKNSKDTPFSLDNPSFPTILSRRNQAHQPPSSATRNVANSSISPSSRFPDSSLSSSSFPKSGAADAAPTFQTLDHHLLRRLLQQNEIIREAWEAERKYLDSNRRRVEQVYQEERLIMDEVCETWETEKAALLLEIDKLKGRVRGLEQENLALKAGSPRNSSQNAAFPTRASQQDGAVDNSGTLSLSSPNYGPGVGVVHSPNQRPTHRTKNYSCDPLTLPPGLDGASRRPHFAYPGSSRTSPTRVPEPVSYLPLDPRIQPETSTNRDFLPTSSSDDKDSIPVIDVRELDPKLEGIPLKAPAVQKATFGTNGSSVTSPASPPPTADEQMNTLGQALAPDQPPRDATVQALRDEELKRLTMHAGHTPNHSLSKMVSMNVADSGGVPGSDDEGSSPSPAVGDCSLPRTFGQRIAAHGAGEEGGEANGKALEKHNKELLLDHPEEQLEATNDVRLKGPLMIKNIPAQDEIFLDQLNKRLESIGHGEDALPTVMSSPPPDDDEDPVYSVSGSPGHNQWKANPVVGGDASQDVFPEASGANDGEDAAAKKTDEVEQDVPLKIRGTSNFGAPFGVA
ncbi:unnamed protein product [Clonostachys rosea]|uniref:GDP/GTP exchange factor Sec2 N-terminal domain-containing protein n=1 Tax=Bionectria ochroleuca TaxID=29856 RepID=A0ABY6TSE3_BIOOC|nr:unnamed protein product [Clonostachys rosea]